MGKISEKIILAELKWGWIVVVIIMPLGLLAFGIYTIIKQELYLKGVLMLQGMPAIVSGIAIVIGSAVMLTLLFMEAHYSIKKRKRPDPK